MIVAQLAVPLAAVVSISFAIWFSVDVLLRTSPSKEVNAAAEEKSGLTSSFLCQLIFLAMVAALSAGGAFGAIVGVYRDSIGSGVVAGLAVLAGVLAAAAAAGIGFILTQQASARAATTADRTLRQALAIMLWGGAAPALVGGVLAIVTVTGLYGIATRFADISSEQAAFLILGTGAGAALTALATRLLAANKQSDEHGPQVETVRFASSAAGSAETLALVSAGGAGGIVLGAPMAQFSTEDIWLMAPLVLVALGLLATTISAITLPFWARALRNAGRAVIAGYLIAAVLTAALSFTAPLLLLEEGRWWFSGAALTGWCMSALIFLTGRTLARPGEGHSSIGAVFILLAGAALVGAFVLGRQVEIGGVSPTATALYGIAMAAAGALSLAPSGNAVSWFGSGTANAVALAERARQEAKPPEDGHVPIPLGPLSRAADQALASGLGQAVGWTALVGAISVAALLLAVRTELGNIAEKDVPQYVNLAVDLGVIPKGAAPETAAAYKLETYRNLLDRHDVAKSDVPQLMLAGDDETRHLMELRAEQRGLKESPGALEGGPWPFPALPSIQLDGLTGLGALVGLIALLGAINLSAPRRSWGKVQVWAGLFISAAFPVGVVLIARQFFGGNSGWELAAGVTIATLIAGIALAAQGGDKSRSIVPREFGLALALWMGAGSAVIAPTLVGT